MVHQNGTPSTPRSEDLPVAKHGQRYRATMTVALDLELDADIIQAINAIPKSKRQERLKNALRGGMPQLTAVELDRNEVLLEILDGVRWLRSYFLPFHAYLEEKFSRIGGVVFGSVPVAPAKPVEAKKLTDAQRKARLKNTEEAEW